MTNNKIKNLKFSYSVVRFFYYFTIITTAILLISMLFACFSPAYNFTAVKERFGWTLTYKLFANYSTVINVPYGIVQSLDIDRINIKNMFIIYLLTKTIITSTLMLLGLKGLIDIISNVIYDNSPFNSGHVKIIRRIAWYIIIYFLFTDLIVNIACDIFVTHIFLLTLSNINLYGLLYGGLVFVLADIFEYGSYLQNEYDTTI